MTKTKNRIKVVVVDMTKLNRQQKKKFAVDEIVATSVKSVADSKLYRQLSELTGLSVSSLKRAYENFSNFGKIDCRFDRANAVKAKGEVDVYVSLSDESKAKIAKNAKTKTVHLKPSVIGQLIHEYYFGYRGHLIDFLNGKNALGIGINKRQWYGWIRDIAITGKISGWREVAPGTKNANAIHTKKGLKYYRKSTKTVLDYRKYGKGYLKAALKIAKASVSRTSSEAKLFAGKIFRGMSKNDIKNAQKTCHVLDMYL